MIFEFDFSLYKDLAKAKTFVFTDKNTNLPVDLSGATNLTLNASLDGFATTPISIVGVLSGPNNNVVTFTFAVGDTATLGNYVYIVFRDESLGTEDVLSGGNISIILKEAFSTSLDTIIDIETPTGLILSGDIKNNRIRYWRLYLQTLINPSIADVDIDDELKWPALVNILIAKLVIYDSLALESKKAFIQSSGGGQESQQGGGSLKKLETGPSNAEWYDTAEMLKDMFKPNKDGVTPFSEMQSDLCQLAHRLRIFLPLCGQLVHSPVVPVKQGRVPLDDPITILQNYSDNKIISNG